MIAKLRKFYETGNRVNDEPLGFVFEDFLSDIEVEHVLAAAHPKLKQALVSAINSGVTSAGRSGNNCWIPYGYDAVIGKNHSVMPKSLAMVSNTPNPCRQFTITNMSSTLRIMISGISPLSEASVM